MLRRLVFGLLIGLLVGAALSAALVLGLKVASFVGVTGAILAYLSAAVAGMVTGLVAGKPVWVSGAKIEAGLKAFFGAIIGCALMFVLRRWAGAWVLDLTRVGAGGPASVGDLPAASVPLIAAVLGALFELDNTGEPTSNAPPNRKRVESTNANGARSSRVAELDEAASSGHEGEPLSKRAKR
jgi:hypothetical protein